MSMARECCPLSGRLDASTIRDLWQQALRAVADTRARRIVVDARAVEYCDGAGIALLVDLLRQRPAGEVEIENLKPTFDALLKQFDPARLKQDLDPEPRRGSSIEEIGGIASEIARDTRNQIAFVGETTLALIDAARHPRSVRWKDVWRICERVGADALPIVALISFLVGVILAFQSAIPMKRFGAEIFVADLIGLAMLRELAPLMTAILLAGRSGAAFAAEIGTMKVNEEVNALTTMGPRTRALPRRPAHHRGAADDAAACTLFADLGEPARRRADDAVVRHSVRDVPPRGRRASSTSPTSWPGFVKSFVLRGRDRRASAACAACRPAAGAVVRRRRRHAGRRLGHHPARHRRPGVFAVLYFVLDI
jgi:anti-anti-sigma regulatory factor